MEKKDIREVLQLLRVAYPSSFKDMTTDAYTDTLKLWWMMFSGEDVNLLRAAVIALIGSRQAGYTPTIGEVSEKLRELKHPDDMTDQEAWTLVSRACKNGYYGYLEEYKKLPESIQRAVGRPEQLREWSQIDEETFETVTASNFKRTYRTLKQRQEEFLRIPESVREKLPQIANVTKHLDEGGPAKLEAHENTI